MIDETTVDSVGILAHTSNSRRCIVSTRSFGAM